MESPAPVWASKAKTSPCRFLGAKNPGFHNPMQAFCNPMSNFSTATYSNPPKDRKHMKNGHLEISWEHFSIFFGAYYTQLKSRTKKIHHYFLHPRSWTWCPNGVLGPKFRTSSTPRSWFYMVQSKPQPSHSPVMKDPGATTTANGSTFAMWPTSDYSIVRWDRGWAWVKLEGFQFAPHKRGVS